MKKTIQILAVLFSVVIVLALGSYKANYETQLSSLTPEPKEIANNNSNNHTLLRTMSAIDEISNIESITILDETCIAVPLLTNKENMEFLQKYTYSHYRSDKRENWDGWLEENSDFSLKVNTKTQGEYCLFVMNDGSIAVAQMCGDSQVPEISYDFYTADKNDVISREKLEKF